MPSFLFVIFIGLAIRLFLVGNPGFIADIAFWKSWGLAAIDHGVVWTTYNTNINYPPGFIYVLWLMGKLYSLIGNPHDYNTFWRENNFGFLLASKSIAIISDTAIAFLIYWFFSQKPKDTSDGGRPIRPWRRGHDSSEVEKSKSLSNSFTLPAQAGVRGVPSTSFRMNPSGHLGGVPLALLLSSIFFLNPIVIIDSALWGQVESFGILFTLIAIVLLFYRRPLLATAIFTVGTLMKLQNIIFIPLFFLFIFRRFDIKTTIKSLAIAVVTFFFVNLPFVLGNEMKQVLNLMTVNSDYFPFLSLNAHNLWWIVAGTKGMEISDKITVLGIVNAKTTGLLLFSIFYLLSSILLFLRPTPRNFFLSLTLAVFAFFLFTTQSHERYSYPVIVLLLFFYPFLESRTKFLKNPKSEYRNSKPIRSANDQNSKPSLTWLKRFRFRILNLDIVSDLGFRASNFHPYFWLLYFLLTATIFFNIHTGLILNYPQNGFAILTRLTTPALSIFNSYFLILLFFLLLPFIFSQISPLFFVLCSLFFVSSLTALNFSYLVLGKVSLTAFKPIIIKQDYGTLQTNKSLNSFSGWKSWNRLSNNYFYYRKGFGTHAYSNLVFDLNHKFKKLSTDYGIDTEAGTPATVVFKIYGDGKQLFQSDKVGRFDFPSHVEVDISGIKYLGLVVEDAGDGINHDHADWFNPMLYK